MTCGVLGWMDAFWPLQDGGDVDAPASLEWGKYTAGDGFGFSFLSHTCVDDSVRRLKGIKVRLKCALKWFYLVCFGGKDLSFIAPMVLHNHVRGVRFCAVEMVCFITNIFCLYIFKACHVFQMIRWVMMFLKHKPRCCWIYMCMAFSYQQRALVLHFSLPDNLQFFIMHISLFDTHPAKNRIE